MKNDDLAEALVFGGMMGLVFTVLMAPIVLFFFIMGLFFRAPLAAIFAALFCLAIAWILFLITGAIAADMSPFGGFVFTLFMFCVAAGIAYGLRSVELSSMAFNLECFILEKSILNLGMLGRAFYVFAQIIPGLVVTLFTYGIFFSPSTSDFSNNADYIFSMLILGWLAFSQVMVLLFHRTDHPIGQYLSFTGVPLKEVDQKR